MDARPQKSVRSTCPYCGVGCGIIADVASNDPSTLKATIRGDESHPANFGRLCSKGSALGETLALNDRLLTPQINGSDVSWSKAIEHVATKFSETIQAHGPDSAAFYVSGQLLTEDYYVANKLMKGFIGSANIDTNSRLCMASSVAGHKRAFGTDTVPGLYEDLEQADLIILVGSNLAWCHPVLYQRILAAKKERSNMQIIVIDPRRTVSAEASDLYLPIAPDMDTALFNGLADYLISQDALNQKFIEEHTSGIFDLLAAQGEYDVENISAETGLNAEDIERFYKLYEKTEKTVTIYSQGVNQSVGGTDKVNSIINCHLLTGRIGRPGMGPFSVTGQPNAMGGREVGGLANQLACHMEIDNSKHRALVKKFWSSPTIAKKQGLKAVDLFDAIEAGQVKALWIMATNPADSMPDSERVQKALQDCPFVVVSDVTPHTDTARFADVLLPAAAWGEKDGTVTNSERRISRQKAFLPLPGEAKPDWWALSKVGQHMGYDQEFAYKNPAEIFREYAALSAVKNSDDSPLRRDFNIGALADMSDQHYDNMAPQCWPLVKQEQHEKKSTEHAGKAVPPVAQQAPQSGAVCGPWPASQAVEAQAANDNIETNNVPSERIIDLTQDDAQKRFFANGGFYTPDRRARFIAVKTPEKREKRRRYPLVLNSGRVRDHWHTMTRTAKSAKLSAHIGEPFCELHPDDAASANIGPADLVLTRSPHGQTITRALITERQQRGSIFIPMHWTDQFSSNGRVNALVRSDTDPVSGQPGLKFTPVNIAPFRASWYGFAVMRKKPNPINADYWALAKCKGGWRLELAARQSPDDWAEFAKKLFLIEGGEESGVNMLNYEDPQTGSHRLAFIEKNELIGVLYTGARPVGVARNWASSLLGMSFDGRMERMKILASRAGADQPDPGATICACFDIGINQIRDAVAKQGAASVDDIGRLLRAGTNCGSCRTEIQGIIDHVAKAETH